MSVYSLVLFVHVLGALGLFVTTGIGQLVLARLRWAQTVAPARDWLEVARGVARDARPKTIRVSRCSPTPSPSGSPMWAF